MFAKITLAGIKLCPTYHVPRICLLHTGARSLESLPQLRNNSALKKIIKHYCSFVGRIISVTRPDQSDVNVHMDPQSNVFDQ